VRTAQLTVSVQNATTNSKIPTREQLEAWARAVLDGHAAGELNIRLVDEAESGRLNREYRKREGATNVLSFAADPELIEIDPDAPCGDLVICADVVEREAREQDKATEAHWAHMVVHGALHLLGFDHESSGEAAEMEARERELLMRFGYPDPYGPQS